MKTEDFAALNRRYDAYTQSKHDTKGAGCEAIEREIKSAFAMLTEENGALLSGGELGDKADVGRTFDNNLRQIKQAKLWMEQFEADRRPSQKAGLNPALMGGGPARPGTKSYGAAPFTLGQQDIAELHTAARTKQFMSKAVAVANASMAAIPEYSLDVFPLLRDKPRIRELIPTQMTDRPSVTYYRGTTSASAATAVAEGADKPESSPVWASVTVAMSKIAHYGLINDEVIDDYPGWLQVIAGEFLAGLIDAENDALINGTGVAPQMTGLLNVSGIQTQAFTGNNIDTVALAATKLRTGTSFTEPDVIVMHPANWQTISLFRTGGSVAADGPYLINPLTSPALSLWGIPVVLTNRIAAGTAIVANLKTAAEVFVREEPNIEVHPGGGGLAEWRANKTLIRAEERLALTVPRPTAVVKLTLLT